MNLLKRIFGTKNNDDNLNQLDREFESQLEEKRQQENNKTQAMTPYNNQSHQAFPGLNIEKFYKNITNDLCEAGMDEGIIRKGNPKHLSALLNGVRSNYLDELENLKQDVKNEAINEMHKCRQEVINNHNKLRHIKENLIPETRVEIAEAKEEIGKLQQRNPDEFEDLNSGFNTALIAAAQKTILTFKKNIRELQSKSIKLESENKQLENQEAQLRANIEAFEPFSRDTLDNKLNTFFNGWLKGLELIDANPDFIQQANEIFAEFLGAIDEDNIQSAELRKIA